MHSMLFKSYGISFFSSKHDMSKKNWENSREKFFVHKDGTLECFVHAIQDTSRVS